MTKPSDTQLVLLASAAARDSGSLYPLPPSLRRGGGTAKAVAALLRAGLAEERETAAAADVHRSDDDVRYGVYITPAGLAAVGVTADAGLAAASPSDGPSGEPPAALPAAPPVRTTKTAAVVALLARAEGATLAELATATGWLPHSVRAALTGLRKRGHAVVRSERAGVTLYRIAAA